MLVRASECGCAMIFLALESATSRSSVAIFEDQKLLGFLECDARRSLTPQIIPTIDQLLASASLTMADLQGLAISIGPGTFTGLRVGLATMTAFRFALGIPLVGVSTLEGLAWNLPDSELPILSTVSIRSDMVYWGLFRWRDDQLVRAETDQIGNLSEVCAGLSEPTVVLGDGWLRNQEYLQSVSSAVVAGPADVMWPSAKGIGPAGLKLLEQGDVLPESCVPRYIQPSYAKIPSTSISHSAMGEDESSG